MNVDTGKSRDFEEITLAITILTGLSFVLFKIADYFGNNTIGFSDNLQSLVSIFVSGLLIELVIISSFLILKVYLLFAGSREKANNVKAKKIADAIFKSFITYFVFLGLFSFFLLSFIIASSPTFIENPYYIYIFYAFIILPVYVTFRAIFYLFDFKKDDFIKSVKSVNMQSIKQFLEILGKSGFEKSIIDWSAALIIVEPIPFLILPSIF